jgi:predicted phage terminase large subunit-like protein
VIYSKHLKENINIDHNDEPVTKCNQLEIDDIIYNTAKAKTELLSNLLIFTAVFYKIRTGREFRIPHPVGRQSHYLIISSALHEVLDCKCTKLMINVPPRYGKTEMLINFVAWALAHNAASNFLYISVSHELATKATSEIRNIISSPYYSKMFNVKLREDSAAKDNFITTEGGTVSALGSGSTIVGRGAGIRGLDSFGGCLIIDDIHKPDEIYSKLQRQNAIDWYYNTLLSRRNNGEKTAQIFIGQRLHEEDLPGHLLAFDDWKSVILPAIDESGNALCPDLHTIQELRKMQKLQEYVFAAQMQQNPQPEGGSIFKQEYFKILEVEPDLIATFITCDTAESTKDYADYTVFSFFGLYKITQKNIEVDLYGIHWIDCREMRIEPKDLQSEFLEFYSGCMQHSKKPRFCAIEKKSTGATLVSVLQDIQGLNIIPIERTKASGSKTVRFLEMQPYIASKCVTFSYGARHVVPTINHMCKITINDSHAHDDIADTLYDAIKLALIDKTFLYLVPNDSDKKKEAEGILKSQKGFNTLKSGVWN